MGQPKKALCAIGRKSKRKEKKGGGGKGKKDSTHQTKLDSVWGGDLPPLARPTPLGVLGPQGKAPPSSPYIYVRFRADLKQLCHGSPTTYLHGFTSRSRFLRSSGGALLRRDHHQPPERRNAAGELFYLSVSLAGSRRPRSSSSCTCAERGGAVRSEIGRAHV